MSRVCCDQSLHSSTVCGGGTLHGSTVCVEDKGYTVVRVLASEVFQQVRLAENKLYVSIGTRYTCLFSHATLEWSRECFRPPVGPSRGPCLLRTRMVTGGTSTSKVCFILHSTVYRSPSHGFFYCLGFAFHCLPILSFFFLFRGRVCRCELCTGFEIDDAVYTVSFQAGTSCVTSTGSGSKSSSPIISNLDCLLPS